jgi:hypothetical protein
MTKRKEEEVVYIYGEWWPADEIRRRYGGVMSVYDSKLTDFLKGWVDHAPTENWRNDPLYFSAAAKRMKREGKI